MLCVDLIHNDSNISRVAQAHVWCVNAIHAPLCIFCQVWLHQNPTLPRGPQPKCKAVPAFRRPSQI